MPSSALGNDAKSDKAAKDLPSTPLKKDKAAFSSGKSAAKTAKNSGSGNGKDSALKTSSGKGGKDNAHIMSVSPSPTVFGAYQVTADIGRGAGASPGTALSVYHGGREIGLLEVTSSETESCKGVFHPVCDGCRPEKGDEIPLAVKNSFSLIPLIRVPGAPTAAAGGLPAMPDFFPVPLPSPEKEGGLQKVFDDFSIGATLFPVLPVDEAEDVSGWKLSGKAQYGRKDCPGAAGGSESGKGKNGSGYDGGGVMSEDLKTEIFLKPGDVIRATGWEGGRTFCASVGGDYSLVVAGWGGITVRGKTLLALEAELHRKYPAGASGMTLDLLTGPGDM